MTGTSIEGILQQVAQLPLSERQLLKQLLNYREAQAVDFNSESNLSLAQAAELLNVSTRFIEGLLARGELKSAASTNPTTIKLSDLLAYKKINDEEAVAILNELTAQAQELEMGYESGAEPEMEYPVTLANTSEPVMLLIGTVKIVGRGRQDFALSAQEWQDLGLIL